MSVQIETPRQVNETSMQMLTNPQELRAAARRGDWRGTTAGHCPSYQQANLVILPKDCAIEFAAFCTRNPAPCPVIEITPPGDPEPAHAAPGADLRTDLPGYRVYRNGSLAEQRADIRELWRDDLVSVLLGCSFTFEHALIEAGLPRETWRSIRKFPCLFPTCPVCRQAGFTDRWL